MQDIAISVQPFLFLVGMVSSSISNSNGGGNLTGSSNPNGVVTGTLGQIYTQVVGTAITIWVNVDGGTTWT